MSRPWTIEREQFLAKANLEKVNEWFSHLGAKFLKQVIIIASSTLYKLSSKQLKFQSFWVRANFCGGKMVPKPVHLRAAIYLITSTTMFLFLRGRLNLIGISRTDNTEPTDSPKRSEKYDIDRTIRLYMAFRSNGTSDQDIAKNHFKVSTLHRRSLRIFSEWGPESKVGLPSASAKSPHSYPFISGDTFKAFSDMVFESAQSMSKKAYAKELERWDRKITC